MKMRQNLHEWAVSGALAVALAVFGRPALAADYDIGPIHIGQPWARATPKGATVGAGYMTVTNRGTTPDRLTCVATEAAAQCQVHTMAMEQGVMKMRPVAEGVVIKPGETVEFKPAGLHLMFVGLKDPLAAGKTVRATLKFEHAGSIAVDYAISPVGASAPPAAAPAAPGKPMDHMRM